MDRKEDIRSLLYDLHQLNYFFLSLSLSLSLLLSFSGIPYNTDGRKVSINKVMQDPTTSQRYRDRLAYKITV